MKSKTTSILVSLLIVLVIALIVGILYYFAEKQNVLDRVLKEQKETSTKIEKKDNPIMDTDFSCPLYTPPSPGWCADGIIIPSPKDINGCNVPPTCLPRQNNNSSFSCPTYAPPSPGWCAYGIIVPSPKDINGCNIPPTCLPRQNNNSSLDKGLEIAFQNYKNGQISECKYDTETYYYATLNVYDGGGQTFDSNGNIVGTYHGFTGNYTGFFPKNCEKIYAVFPNIWGYPPINKYNLK